MADLEHELALKTAIDFTERAADLAKELGDRPAAEQCLRRALAELRAPVGSEPPAQGVAVSLIRMALALTDREDRMDVGVWLQHAIDTYEGQPVSQAGPALDAAVERHFGIPHPKHDTP